MLTGGGWVAADVRTCLTHLEPQTINQGTSRCELLTFHPNNVHFTHVQHWHIHLIIVVQLLKSSINLLNNWIKHFWSGESTLVACTKGTAERYTYIKMKESVISAGIKKNNITWQSPFSGHSNNASWPWEHNYCIKDKQSPHREEVGRVNKPLAFNTATQQSKSRLIELFTKLHDQRERENKKHIFLLRFTDCEKSAIVFFCLKFKNHPFFSFFKIT